MDEDDDGKTDPDEVLRVRIPVGTARAFAKRTHKVVGAERSICVNCGQSIDAARNYKPVACEKQPRYFRTGAWRTGGGCLPGVEHCAPRLAA